MSRGRVGLALRLIGPALEIICIGLLLRGSGRGRSVLGQPVEPVLYVGVAVGLAMVAIGLSLSMPQPRRRRDPDESRR